MDSFETFLQLHHASEPLLIGNAWDAGSAKLFEQNGFKAIATSSAAVAIAHGYEDGEKIPFDKLLLVVEEIYRSIHIPLSVDLESGYGSSVQAIIRNIEKLHDAGVVGINIEDSVKSEPGKLQPAAQFQKTISSIGNHLQQRNINLFINARTDTFLLKLPNALEETLMRAKIYSETGVHGIFVPFIINKSDIQVIVEATDLPLNVLCAPLIPSIPELTQLRVKRISMGSSMYRALNRKFENILQTISRRHSVESLF